jgi:hypothetical protein
LAKKNKPNYFGGFAKGMWKSGQENGALDLHWID